MVDCVVKQRTIRQGGFDVSMGYLTLWIYIVEWNRETALWIGKERKKYQRFYVAKGYDFAYLSIYIFIFKRNVCIFY